MTVTGGALLCFLTPQSDGGGRGVYSNGQGPLLLYAVPVSQNP